MKTATILLFLVGCGSFSSLEQHQTKEENPKAGNISGDSPNNYTSPYIQNQCNIINFEYRMVDGIIVSVPFVEECGNDDPTVNYAPDPDKIIKEEINQLNEEKGI